MIENPIKIFNSEMGTVRTTIRNKEPYFSLKDICKILDISSVSVVKTRLDVNGMIVEKVKVITGEKSNGEPAIQEVETTFVDESNLYKTIFQSRKPEASRFSDWLTKDVLPKIRKHGFYAVDELLEDPDVLVRTLEKLKAEKDKRCHLESKKMIDKHKVEFFEITTGSKTAIELKNLHKELNFRSLTRNRLFEILREEEIVNHENIPYQQYIDRGYFRVLEQRYSLTKGEIRIDIKSIVYLKGINYIKSLLLKKAGKTHEQE